MAFWERHWRAVVLSAIGLIFSLVAYWLGLFKSVENILSWFEQPIQATIYHSLTIIKPNNTPVDQLTVENDILKQQLATATQTTQHLEEQLQQYQELSKQLTFISAHNYRTTAAEIISRIGQGSSTQLFSLDRGSDDGLAIGQPVLYGDGVLVGIVHDVTATTANVTPITSSYVTLQASVQNNDHTAGLVKGQFGTGVLMDFILQDQAIAVGDRVTTSGRDDGIPSGLLIGTVQQVNNTTGALFKSANITPELPYNEFSVVSVIISE